ncbi:MAG: phosphorybosylanthranilate isomerase, partial [Cyanobacteria bacterium]|nr:phosphorybosylanthranilate isomerase [Cyanobacteria bacterium CG_2015-09_32_10]
VADGVIVSSSLKRHGKIDETIDPSRVSQFIEAAQTPIILSNSSTPSVIKTAH